MLVEREIIETAKAKLADANFEIIMSNYGVKDYDTANKKCICIFHEENTPSFVYNPKKYNMHCFGCSKTVDIIDSFMHTGLTYLEAVKKLFEIAEIQHSFGELKVKTKHQYKYPQEEPINSKHKVYEYLAQRKISKETIDYADIREDAQGNIVFNYYDDNDVLTLVKYRPSHKIIKGESKMWCQKGADTCPLLFNMNRINIGSPLLICEGETDALAAIESGFTNVVSVPLGAGNFGWIEENWDWLQQFEKIIICSDNDKAGIKMQKEVIYRLGSWRTQIIDIPLFYTNQNDVKIPMKDLNEYLYWYGKEKTLNLILTAKDSPIDSLIDFADVDDIDLCDIDGIYTGIEQLDQELMRMFYGSLTLFTGTPGSGKTSFLYQLICQSLDQEKDAWLFSKELPSYMTRNWINYIFAGNRNVNTYQSTNGTEYYKVRNDTKKSIGEFYRGRLFLYKDGWSNNVEDIQTSMIDSARKNGSKLFILDNLLTINLHSNDDNKYDRQTDFINWLIEFSTKYNVCCILVAHPRKVQEPNNALSKYDIGGSSNMINLAHRSIGLRRVTEGEKMGIAMRGGRQVDVPSNSFNVMATIIKDRLRGREGLEIGLHYDRASRRFFSNPKEYGHQYLWDKNTYSDNLTYPVVDETVEVFGTMSTNTA